MPEAHDSGRWTVASLTLADIVFIAVVGVVSDDSTSFFFLVERGQGPDLPQLTLVGPDDSTSEYRPMTQPVGESFKSA